MTDAECDAIVEELAGLDLAGAGTREMLSRPWCKRLVETIRESPAFAGIVPRDFVAVQCTYFRKSKERNWLVAWHQDLTIPVAERVDHPELSGWSDKEGGLFVHPLDSLLDRLVAVRIHLDECGAEDGPLRVMPSTHRLGRLDPDAIDAARRNREEIACVVPRGGALAMRPLLLHASSKATGPGERRVLHFLFAPAEAPCGLRWALAI